jgi:hypothetical protein
MTYNTFLFHTTQGTLRFGSTIKIFIDTLYRNVNAFLRHLNCLVLSALSQIVWSDRSLILPTCSDLMTGLYSSNIMVSFTLALSKVEF